MKTWKLTVTEDELKNLIEFHSIKHSISNTPDVERSKRIHDLTKRLNDKNDVQADEPEPQPSITKEQATNHIPSGW